MTNSVCTQSSNSFKTQSLSFQTKSKVRFDMERLKCLNLEPVTFVGTYAASLPLGNAESSRPAVLVSPRYVRYDIHRPTWSRANNPSEDRDEKSMENSPLDTGSLGETRLAIDV